jgi:hypothetical protein
LISTQSAVTAIVLTYNEEVNLPLKVAPLKGEKQSLAEDSYLFREQSINKVRYSLKADILIWNSMIIIM